MSDPIVSSFERVIDEAANVLKSRWAWPSPEAGFAISVFHASGEAGPVPAAASLEWPPESLIRHAHTLAACGYLIACGPSISDYNLHEWAKSLDHLTACEPFPLDRQSFTFRPLEVVGIVAGAASYPRVQPDSRARLIEIVRRLPAEGNSDAWSALLYSLATFQIGTAQSLALPREFEKLPASALALAKWLAVAYEANLDATTACDFDKLDHELLERCATGPIDITDIARASLIYYSLKRTVSERLHSRVRESWPVNRESQDAIAVIEQLCRRFPLFAKQLQQRRCDVAVQGTKAKRPTIEMRDEYDVQDSLHAILKLHFDDVRPEEWAPSYAGGQSRMDFVLKREKIVVETKFMGPKLTQTEVAKQLAIDEKFYRSYPDCMTLICFVYDPNGRCDNPAALEGDVSTISDGFRVLVIVSPRGL